MRSLNGTSELIDVATLSMINATAVIAVGAWIKGTDTSGAIFSSDTGTSSARVIQFNVTTSGANGVIQLVLFRATSTAVIQTGTVNVADGAYHHVCGFWDGTTMAIYVDGVLDTSSVPTAPSHTIGGRPARIGAHLSGISQALYGGSIGHVFLSSSAITARQIKSLANGLLPSHFGFDHYWPLWGDSPEIDLGQAAHSAGTLTGTTSVSGGPSSLRPLVLA